MSENEEASSKAAETIARTKSDPAADVHQWLQEVHYGTLSTISQTEGLEGFPIGSIVPFAVDTDGKPYVLIAEIAAHTKNLLNSDKMNLFISHPSTEDDPQTNWRASLAGRMKRIVSPRKADLFSKEYLKECHQITEREEKILLARYAERVPNAEQYLNVHNFSFWKLEDIAKVRYIAGFGRICWIEASEMVDDSNAGFEGIKQSSIEHMNEDHEDSMVTLCEGAHSFKPERVELLDLDSRGILMETKNPDKLVFSSFGKVIEPSDLRVEIVRLIQDARAKIK
jgi:putative heme iron utilization protein